jgi:protein ImuB
MPFACMYVADFPVSAVLRAEPELSLRPVAVLEGVPPLGTVTSLNQHARAAGVTLGMTRLQAQNTAAVLRPRSEVREQAAHAALLDCAFAFSPRIEDTSALEPPGQIPLPWLPSPTSPRRWKNVVLLDLGGLERLHGPARKIANALAQRALALGLRVHISVAATPDAALLLARGRPGITIVPTGEEARMLAPLPVEVLDLAPPIVQTLARWGVRSLGELAALPEIGLIERLGQQGKQLRQLACGQAQREIVPLDPPLTFSEGTELEAPIELLEPLLFVLSRLLQQLCARLRARSLALQELRLDLTLEAESRSVARPLFSRTLRFPVPLCDPAVFLKLLHLDLQAHPVPAPVMAACITAEPARPRTAQNGLFAPQAPEPARLELTLARIAALVGAERVGTPALLDTHRPDSFRLEKFSPPDPSPASLSAHPSAALRLFRPPLAACVELRQQSPSHVVFAGVRRKVLAHSGPWRSAGQWWNESAWAHEEWDVVLGYRSQHEALPQPVHVTAGVLICRLYRDLRSGAWFVAGSYD